MKEFIEMLKKIKPNVDFENEEALVDDGILESLDIISIISEIAEEDLIKNLMELNNRPRKCLNYQTPFELFLHELSLI